MDVSQNLTFSFQFYHHVTYLGNCREVSDSRMYGLAPAVPTFFGELPGICLALIALILNGLSLIVFCVDEWGGLRIHRSKPESTSASEKINRSTVVTSIDTTQTTYSTTISLGKRATGAHAKRSSVTLSLLILCLCECVFAFGKLVFRTSIFSLNYAVSSTIESMDMFDSMRARIETFPVLQNFIFFISDVGLMCRNWCVCLITIARAEVVMWPLGSRSWQRILRTRRWFLISFLVIMCLAILLAYLKHADFIGLLCFDSSRLRFGLWMDEFLMTQQHFGTFELFGYHMIQTCLVWCLIFVFTIVIIARLKPWKQDVDKLFSSLQHSPVHHTLKTTPGMQPIGVQADTMRRRQCSQIRATRVVVVIVMMFLILEFASFISVAMQFAGIIDPHSSTMRTLESVANTLISTDSIGNFIVFVLTMKQFRILCLRLFCCQRPGRRATSAVAMATGQGSHMNTGGSNNDPNQDSTERAELDLE